MSYYTQRQGMRKEKDKTYSISVEAYSVLFECCKRYLINLAWKFPDFCHDGNVICDYDLLKLTDDLQFEIPSLFGLAIGDFRAPRKTYNAFQQEPETEEYDQYALLDYIEYIAANCRDYRKTEYHSFFRHNHYSFLDTNTILADFRKDINEAFTKVGVLYELNENGEIEKVLLDNMAIQEISPLIQNISEPGLKDLLQEAVDIYKKPYPNASRDATEKIWDAFERLKTYYVNLDKKASAAKIVTDISMGVEEYHTLINNEFAALTKIGNDYRIRHHETNKIEIKDDKQYQYFFNRCLSLISLALQYLQ